MKMIVLLVAMIIGSITQINADVITLKNGATLEGIIVEQTDSVVHLDVGVGSLGLARDSIAQIAKSDESTRRQLREAFAEQQSQAAQSPRVRYVRQAGPQFHAGSPVYHITYFDVALIEQQAWKWVWSWEIRVVNPSSEPVYLTAEIVYCNINPESALVAPFGSFYGPKEKAWARYCDWIAYPFDAQVPVFAFETLKSARSLYSSEYNIPEIVEKHEVHLFVKPGQERVFTGTTVMGASNASHVDDVQVYARPYM